MLAEALQARLTVLENELLRITKQAFEATKQDDQDNHWRLAQDFQSEARELRQQIRKIAGFKEEANGKKSNVATPDPLPHPLSS